MGKRNKIIEDCVYYLRHNGPSSTTQIGIGIGGTAYKGPNQKYRTYRNTWRSLVRAESKGLIKSIKYRGPQNQVYWMLRLDK